MSRRLRKGRETVSALVVGAGLNGLGVARSLHSAGVPVWLADSDPRRPEMHTRSAKPVKLADSVGSDFIPGLVELAKRHFAGQRPVLLLTQEHAVRAFAEAQDVLRPWFRFVSPPAAVLKRLMHKPTFDRLAREGGLRVPLTVRVRSAADIDSAVRLTMPVIVKPALRAAAFERVFRKAYLVEEPGEAASLLGDMLAVLSDLIVQEWIPGRDSDLYFCLQQLSEAGEVEAAFVGRKIRAWPPQTGGTASCLPAPEAAQLASATSEFFVRTGVCGLAGMEFKRHVVTGEFFAIEPTVGRTDHQEEVAALNGVNIPYAYYRSSLGLSPVVPSAGNSSKKPVIWCDRPSDRCSAVDVRQHVRDWPVPATVRDALWRASDPIPWTLMFKTRFEGKLRSLYRSRIQEAART